MKQENEKITVQCYATQGSYIPRKRDKYDEAVEYLTENPHNIPFAWASPYDVKGGELFKFLSFGDTWQEANTQCGCPSMVKRASAMAPEAFCKELTDFVRQHNGIPLLSKEIAAEHLPAFAEVQRYADKLRAEVSC